jgi:hypothetical protein
MSQAAATSALWTILGEFLVIPYSNEHKSVNQRQCYFRTPEINGKNCLPIEPELCVVIMQYFSSWSRLSIKGIRYYVHRDTPSPVPIAHAMGDDTTKPSHNTVICG